MLKKIINLLICCTALATYAALAAPSADLQLSPNGYSGLGLVPSATALPTGTGLLTFDPTLPGAKNTSGYNTQIGFGLYDNIELVGRLATNDLKCNMFRAGACPPNNIRDFSASMKWSLPINWLKEQNAAVALGMTDVGGAANYFKSYYVVGSKSWGALDVSLGQAKAMADYALLKGSFGALSWRATDWSKLSVQRIGPNTWANASLQAPVFNTGMNAWLTFNHKINDAQVTDKNWIGWGVSVPLDRVANASATSSAAASTPVARSAWAAAPEQNNRKVASIHPNELAQAFRQRGFYNPKIGKRPSGALVFELENTSYLWNMLDGAGVALGLIAGAYGTEANAGQPQDFELILTSRGIRQVLIKGEASCVEKWLTTGTVCSSLSAHSMLQQAFKVQTNTDDVAWSEGKAWAFRPELVISPTLTSTIGTEYGAFDMDVGANLNTVLPLWSGAVLESNRIKPLGIGTRGFEQGGVFYASRLKPATNRTLFHQLINLPAFNTQARISAGTAYTVWDGRQIETSTQSETGRHKLGLTSGSFKTDTLQFNNEKTYHLVNYRYAHDDNMSTVSEITQGKFWGGDTGWNIGQRFWHGDTVLNVYLRRSRMSAASPLVSFAGVQFSIPFTPRENKSLASFGVRGVSQWTYTLETRVFDKENIITGGFGEVPKMGDSLLQTFNRDRNSTRYLESNLSRLKNAFANLAEDDTTPKPAP